MKRLLHFSLLLVAALVSLGVAYLFLDWPSAADVPPTALVNSHVAPQVQAAQLSLGSEFTVCTETHHQRTPAIHGPVVVWVDDRNSIDNDIYGYDLDTKQEFTVCTATNFQGNPALYGNVVVWEDFRSGIDDDIYGYDLSTKQEFTICTAAADQRYPAIYGSVVVWQHYRSATNEDIYGYDLNTKQEFTLCTETHYQGVPAIYGNVVVWRDDRNGDSDIYGYDLSTRTEFTVCTETTADQDKPVVYGHVVVWVDDRNAGTNPDIYGYDLDTKREFTVCTAANVQEDPAIYGPVVVWEDFRDIGTSPNIYGYDLNTGQEFTVCTETNFQGNPALYGNVVVWEDDRNSNDDIYGAWLLTELSPSYKAANVITTTPGGVLAYTIALSNPGSVPSFFTHLTDTVPASTTYLSGSLEASSGTTEAAGNEIRWRGVISAGLPVTVTYRTRVSNTVAIGDLITNAAYVDDGYAPFWTNVVTSTVGNVEIDLPLIMNNQTISATVQ